MGDTGSSSSSSSTSTAAASVPATPATSSSVADVLESARRGFNPRSAFANIPKRAVMVPPVPKGVKQIKKCMSNDVVVLSDCDGAQFHIMHNQRLSMIMCCGLRNCKVVVLDSAVVASRTCRIVMCDNCEFVFEDVDVRKVECFKTTNCRVVFIGDEAVLENARVLWREACTGNTVTRGEIVNDEGSPYLEYRPLYSVPATDTSATKHYCTTLNPVQFFHNVKTAAILPGSESLQVTTDGVSICTALFPFTLPTLPGDELLNSAKSIPSSTDVMSALAALQGTPFPLSEADLTAAYDLERVEYEDPEPVLIEKVKEIAAIIKTAKHVVVYTGAGISTSSGIPDFRGPQGCWTMRDKGKRAGGKSLTGATPTLAHYALTELARRLMVHFIVTTNMDALHLRSGFPPNLLVEMHGCSHKEFCEGCHQFYMRSFNVNSHRMDHITERKCKFCGSNLLDTIVNFSDTYRTPLDPITALLHARKADVAIVMGTSMNVQGAASYPDKALQKTNGKLIIINLQNTPYDHVASVRVFARTDRFMQYLMSQLGITEFDMTTDVVSTWSH
ncbi:silent information regulator family protein [Pelomyxa schiedti]|nr:silent information regulator family protein [Pelomyxa schiedti]